MQPTYVYSYNAGILSLRGVPADYTPQAGEFISTPEPATNLQLMTWFPGWVPAPSSAPLLSLANAINDGLLKGTVTVDVGTLEVPQPLQVGISTNSLILLQGAAALATANPSMTFTWVNLQNVTVTLTAAQIQALFLGASMFIQDCFSVLSQITAAITAGTVTTRAQVQNPPSPLPPWPVNS